MCSSGLAGGICSAHSMQSSQEREARFKRRELLSAQDMDWTETDKNKNKFKNTVRTLSTPPHVHTPL